jgi:hypothetical protein
LAGQREEEPYFFHVVLKVVDESQREDPFLDGVDQILRSNDASEKTSLKPLKFDILGIDVPFTFVFRVLEDSFDDFLVDQSLEDFLICKIFSPVQADYQLATIWLQTCDNYFYLFFHDWHFVEPSQFVEFEVVFENDDFKLFVEVPGECDLEGLVHSQWDQLFVDD